MRLGKTTLIHFSSQAGKSLAGFIATLYIARVLGAETLGIYAVTVAVMHWLLLPTGSIASAITKRVSEGREAAELLTAGITLNAVLVAAMVLGILGFGNIINSYIGVSLAPLLAFLVVGNTAFMTMKAGLGGQKQVGKVGVFGLVERILRTIFQISLIIFGYKVAGLVFGHGLSFLIVACLGTFFYRLRPTKPSLNHVRRILRYARYSWLGNIKARTFAWMDTIILRFFVASSLIGIYEVAWTLASTLALISLSVQQTLFPEISDLGTDDAYDRILHYLNEGMVFTGIFAIPGFIGAVILGPRLLKIYRPEFKQGAIILIILILARMIAAYGSQFLSALNAIDRPDLVFWINLGFIGTNLGLNIGLIYFFGWHGAAMATSISALVSLLLGYYFLTTQIGSPKIPFGEISRQLLAAGIMAIVIVPLRSIIPKNHYVTVGLVFLGAAVYTLALLAISEYVRGKARSLIASAA